MFTFWLPWANMEPTDAMLGAIATAIPIFWLAGLVTAVPLNPRFRSSTLVTWWRAALWLNFALAAAVEVTVVAWLGVSFKDRPPDVALTSIVELGTVIVLTAFLTGAAESAKRREERKPDVE